MLVFQSYLKCYQDKSILFIIDGIEVKGTKEEFVKKFKKTLLSDKVERDNDLEETTKNIVSDNIAPVKIVYASEESIPSYEENKNEIKLVKRIKSFFKRK